MWLRRRERKEAVGGLQQAIDSPHSGSGHGPNASVSPIHLAHLEGVVFEHIQLSDLVAIAQGLTQTVYTVLHGEEDA